MRTCLWKTVPMTVLGCWLLAGCTYDAKETNAFLLKPRSPVSGKEYRCLPPDSLMISSVHVTEINYRSIVIRPDGRINLPLLGEMYVADKTPKEIEDQINAASGAYYEQVDCTVTVVGFNSQKYYVFGQVLRPGSVPWTGTNTLLDALAQAQPNFTAWPERIRVVRGKPPQSGGVEATSQPAGKYKYTGIHPAPKDEPYQVMTFNLMAMVKNGDMSNNILLMPNDVIYVQPNPLAAVGLAIQSLLLPIRPAVETVAAPAGAAAAIP